MLYDLFLLLIISVPIDFLSTEVASAIGAYITTILSIIAYFRKVLKEQRDLYEAKIDKSVEGLKRELVREIEDMKKDITKNTTDIERNKEKSDILMEEIKTNINQMKIEMVQLVGEIKLAIEHNKK